MIWLIISELGSEKWDLVPSTGCSQYNYYNPQKDDNNSILYTPFTQFYREVLKGNFVIGATSLASTGSGSITISGIPAGSTIVKAFLFWAEEDANNASSGNFNGHPITGIKIAEDCTSCWGTPRNALFYRDVTSYVSGNGTYSLTSFPPLACAFGADGLEGVTLIVIYCNPSEIKRTITIYTGDYEQPACNGPSFSWTHTNFTATNPVVDAKYSISIGNGQNFGESSAEYVYLNSNLITSDVDGLTGPNGPCSNGSLWDAFTGSATSWIPANATSATFSINNAAGSDCWHPVLSVLSVSSVDNETYSCVTPVDIEEKLKEPQIKVYNNIVEISSNYDFKIYSLNGRIIGYYKSGFYKTKLNKGVYIMIYENKTKKFIVD